MEVQVARSDYRVLHWYGDMDGKWSDVAIQRYVNQGADGLVVVPGGEWVPDDLSFVRDLPNLRYLCVEHRLRRDVDAFYVDTLEELSLVTGSRLPVPEMIQSNLTRLTLTSREGISASRWPNLKVLRLGGWRGSDFRMLDGASELTHLHLEGRNQSTSLEGIEGCKKLEQVEALRMSFEDIRPLSGVASIRELQLMAAPNNRHGVIDFSVVASSSLEKAWISNASAIANVRHLAGMNSVREIRLIDCDISEEEKIHFGQLPSYVRVDIF
jgi:hypothetical protein